MLFRSTLAASVALLLVASSVSADAATSANSELKPRDLEERTSAAKVITSCTKSGTFALTFDDGPWNYGHEISSTIVKAGGLTTFFVNGNNYGCIYDWADELIARYKAGHQIAAHTWNHFDITTLSTAELTQQITLLETALEKILGIKPKYFRPPYGNYNTAALKVLKSRGYQVVTWDFDSLDSDGASASQSVGYYKKLYSTYPKPHLALNHETYSSTGKTVVPTVVPKLVAAGYKLVTVAQCLGDSSPYQSVGTPGTRDASWTCNGTPQPNPDRV